jgi:hypothetical protein
VTLKEWCEETEETVLSADGLEGAIVGIAYPWQTQRTPTLVYNREKAIEIIMESSDCTHEEAEEYFEFNTAGAYVGSQTPIFITAIDPDKSD